MTINSQKNKLPYVHRNEIPKGESNRAELRTGEAQEHEEEQNKSWKNASVSGDGGTGSRLCQERIQT